LINYIPSI